jgi:GxxExxY protein
MNLRFFTSTLGSENGGMSEKIAPIHKKQLLTYLKITGIQLGLLINFNEILLKDGITRIKN